MAFPKIPNVTKNQLKKAGDVLIVPKSSSEDYVSAIEIVSQWRSAHAYPMNTFNSTLRAKLRSGDFENFLVAQRLKRMPTIIDKLKRYPYMNLTTMGDIGGLRAILNSVPDVRKLGDDYKKSRFQHKLIGEHDYISNPKSSGYRGIHLIYSYQNKKNSEYDGLRLELQIRTKLQHLWATAVETMGTILGNALKSQQGEKRWLEFFAVTSSAFAFLEKTPLVPDYERLSIQETYREVSKAERKLKVMQRLKGLTIASNEITTLGEEDKRWSYHLIVLNSADRSVSVQSYARDQLARATSDYQEFENRAASGEQIEPVLVSAGRLDQLKKAYPNYFLDTNDFISRVTKIIESIQ